MAAVNLFDPWTSRGPRECVDCGKMSHFFSVIDEQVICSDCFIKRKTQERLNERTDKNIIRRIE